MPDPHLVTAMAAFFALVVTAKVARTARPGERPWGRLLLWASLFVANLAIWIASVRVPLTFPLISISLIAVFGVPFGPRGPFPLKPFSRRLQALSFLAFLLVLNAIPALDGRGRTEIVYLDAFVVTLFGLASVATRIWPDKIWFRSDSD